MGRIGWCELVILVVIVITEVNSQGCSAEINVCDSSQKMQIESITAPECCDTDGACDFKKGTNATITMTYTTKEDFESLEQSLCGKITFLGITECVEMPDLPSDFCQFTSCKIFANKLSTAKLTLPVLQGYPSIKGTGQWSFIDPANKDVVGCVEMKIQTSQ